MIYRYPFSFLHKGQANCSVAALAIFALILSVSGCGGYSQADVKQLAIRRPPDPYDEPRKNDAAQPAGAPKTIAAPPSSANPAVAASAQEATAAQEGARPDLGGLSDTQPPPATPLTPAEQATRSAENLERIAAALVAFREEKRHFPRYAVRDKTGVSLLSWRIELLPYLGHQQLYDQFDLSQPWYAPVNKRLLKHIPAVYQSPAHFDEQTCYRIPIGNRTIYQKRRSVPPGLVEDGMSNTVMLVETDDAVPWTAPTEYEFDGDHPAKGLGSLRAGEIYVAWANGMVGSVPVDAPEDSLRAMYTPDGGERFSSAAINKPIDPSRFAEATLAVEQPGAANGSGVAASTLSVSRGRVAPDASKLASDYQRVAALALAEGDHADAWRWLYGAASLGAMPPQQFQWYPALRRPAFGIHYAIAVVDPEAASRSGASRADVLPDTAQSVTQLVAMTQPFGGPLLLPLEGPATESSIARLLPAPPAALPTRRGLETGPRVRGTFLVGRSVTELRRAANEHSCDVLLVLDVNRPGRNNRSDNRETRFSFFAYDLAQSKPLLRSPRFSFESATLTADELVRDDDYQDFLWKWRDLLEDGLTSHDWPVALSDTIAAKRVAALGESDDPFPPRVLAEMTYYRNRGMVDNQQLLVAMRKAITEPAAMALLLGSAKKKERALREWLPVGDPEQILERAARVATTRRSDD
ncbi:hypothetical protein Mal64_19620 [Pseudobythopirellula maris]|uniref:DUF1559 domain-containing protein n=1 Tax=Pseudobythopirellula maris TaxID=2527991 RepID=A0A5C5ZM56_9BACT|nr:DUF1559 domain-containing protein [Pseudobythopirellula maris]TWT88479.1 hypothetical protein Mal64_19620 [Pseudobythopirellula maris]